MCLCMTLYLLFFASNIYHKLCDRLSAVHCPSVLRSIYVSINDNRYTSVLSFKISLIYRLKLCCVVLFSAKIPIDQICAKSLNCIILGKLIASSTSDAIP